MGQNARETHPIFFHHLLKGVHRGARLIAVDPRRTSSRSGPTCGWASTSARTSRSPTRWRARSSTPGLAHEEFIGRATSGFEAYRAGVEPYTLEYAERETGVPAAAIREAAHAYAKADRAMICWTLGHHRAPQRGRQRPRPDLARAADGARRAVRQRPQPAARPEQRPGRRRHGRAARPAAGFQHVENDELRDEVRGDLGRARCRRSAAGTCRACSTRWTAASSRRCTSSARTRCSPRRTATVTERCLARPRPADRPGHLPDRDGRDRRRRVPGRRGVGGEPRARSRTRERRVQRVRKALEPPGEARDDLWIIFELARRLGHDWGEASAEAVWNEVRAAVAGPRRDELRAARGRGRAPVAVLRREPPGRAVPPLAAVGGPGPGQPRRRSCRSSTTRRSTASTTTSRSA